MVPARKTTPTQRLAAVSQIPQENAGWQRAALLIAFFTSGGSGLILELVWTRQFALSFGTTEAALSAVLAAYMAGLALGSYIFGRWCRRWRQPIRLYIGLELGVALSALALYHVARHPDFLISGRWLALSQGAALILSGRFLAAFLLLGVPTTLMGGTLPSLCQSWPPGKDDGAERLVGVLYGTNLAGAVVGALVAGFFFLPAWGVSHTFVFGVSVNLLAAMIAASVAMSEGIQGRNSGDISRDLVTTDEPIVLRSQWLAIFVSCGLSGLAAIIEEVIWSRSLRLIVGSSTYALTLMLVPFLLGLGLGSYLVSRWSRRIRWPLSVLAALQSAAFLSVYAATYLYPHLPKLFLLAFPWVGPGEGVFLLQAALAVLLLLPLATLLGALFPLCAQVIGRDSSAIGPSVGKLYAVQTCGNVLGAVSAIFWITHFGLRGGLLRAGGLHLAAGVALWLVAEKRLRFRLTAAFGTTAAMFLALLIKPQWQPLYITSGVYQSATVLNPLLRSPENVFRAISRFHLLFYREGPTATVSVYTVPTLERLPHLALAIDGKVDASTGADMATQVLSAHLPLLLDPGAKDICVIGWASGVTAGSALLYPVKSLTAIEIEPEVVSASLAFDRFNHRPLGDPRLRLVIQDARNVLLLQHRRYDVIISEPSNPWLSGPAKLFTAEFFQLGKKRLNTGGVFAQWIQLYGLDPRLLRSMLRTFHSVFPFVTVFQTAEGDLLLLGRLSPITFDAETIEHRFHDPAVRDDLARIDIDDPIDLLGTFLLGWKEMKALVGQGPLNTDDNGLLEFGAPKSLYQDTVQENLRLLRSSFRGIESYLSLPNSKIPVRIAQRAIRRGDWDVADMFGNEVRGLPPSADSAWTLGEIAWKDNDYITAQRWWQEGIRLNPNHFGCLMSKVLADQQLGKFYDAERSLKRLSRHWPDDPFVALIHGVNRLALQDAGGAREYFIGSQRSDTSPSENLTGADDPREALVQRFLPLPILVPFYAAQAGAKEGDERSARDFERQAMTALEHWRASLLAKPSVDSRILLLEIADLLSSRATAIESDRVLLAWISKNLLDPFSHYDHAVSLALLGRAAEAQSEFAQAVAQVTDPEGRLQIAKVRQKLGLAVGALSRPALQSP